MGVAPARSCALGAWMIHLQCGCGQRIKLPESHIGKAVACQTCKQVLRLAAAGFEPGKDDWSGALVIRRGPQRKGERIFLGGRMPIEIGKFPGTTILLGGKKVSRTHCRLTRTDFGWQIEDQNSTNGLFVNGRRVATHDLRDGDMLRVGEYALRYLAASPAHYVDDASSEASAAPPPPPAPTRPAVAPPPVPAEARQVERPPSPPVARPVEDTGDEDEWYQITDEDIVQ